MKLFMLPFAVICIFSYISHATVWVNFPQPSTSGDTDFWTDFWMLCEEFDFLREIDKISKTDSTNCSAIAKYCLRNKDGSWAAMLYERIIPLAIETQKKCKSHGISGKITLAKDKIFTGGFSGSISFCTTSCVDNCKNHSEKGCKNNINGLYNIYDYINIFHINYCLKDSKEIDSTKISHLFGRYLPIKWDLKISCDSEEIPVAGESYVYISGFCSDWQLKKNIEFREARENL